MTRSPSASPGGRSRSNSPLKTVEAEGDAANPWNSSAPLIEDRAIGKQLSSDRPTSACYSFGKSATRDARQKCGDILTGPASDFLGRTSPGVTYDLPMSLVSRWKGTKFGKAARPTNKNVVYPVSSNDLACVIPKFDKYRNKQDGRVVFGRETRSAGAKNGANVVKGSGSAEFYARESPGLVYHPVDKFVRKTVTRHWTMGAKTDVIIGAKSAKNCVDPVIPTEPETAMGKQVLSRKPSALGRSFSKASRFPKNRGGTEGTIPVGTTTRPATAPSGGRSAAAVPSSSSGAGATTGRDQLVAGGAANSRGGGGASTAAASSATRPPAGEGGPTAAPGAAAEGGSTTAAATMPSGAEVAGKHPDGPAHQHHGAPTRPSTPGGGAYLTKIQRGLGKQIDLKSAPVYKISSCSRANRNVAGCMITREDRGPLARFDGMRLPHNNKIPASFVGRRWGS